MELSYKEEVSVGAMVIGGLIAFIIAMFWLTGRSATRHGIPVQVMFADVGGLKEGERVVANHHRQDHRVRNREGDVSPPAANHLFLFGEWRALRFSTHFFRWRISSERSGPYSHPLPGWRRSDGRA